MRLGLGDLSGSERVGSVPQLFETFRGAQREAPEAERSLLGTARDRSHAQLRDHAARVRASGKDQAERERRARAQRSLRTYTDTEGVWHLHAKGAPSDGARIEARLKAETDIVFTDARKAGRRDAPDAYAFDALVRIAETRGDETAPAAAHLFINVDAEALMGTGHAPGAATCDIKGIGLVPVEHARRCFGSAILTILIKKGIDVTTIAHDGAKTMPVAVRRAVLARDQECVVDTCSSPTTQVHHVDWRSRGGEHSVENCRGICDWCHKLIHYQGYQLAPNGDGTYNLRAPP